MLSKGKLHIFLYISREYFLSFLVAFLFFFFIFFINNMLLLAEEILAKRVPFADVIRLIIYSLPQVVALSFPFGSLVGALMAVGRLSSDNELIAFQASGINLGRIFLPVCFLGLLFSVTSFVINDYFLPLGTLNFGKLYRQLIYSNPDLELDSYSIKRYQDSIIVTGKVEEGEIQDLLILDQDPENDERVIISPKARLAQSGSSEGIISMNLDDVFFHSIDSTEKNQFEYVSSPSMIYNILLQDITFTIRNPGPREMSSTDVASLIDELEQSRQKKIADIEKQMNERAFDYLHQYQYLVYAFMEDKTVYAGKHKNLEGILADYQELAERDITDRRLQITKIEYYKKFSIPAACLAFVFFAFPVGLLTRKSGRAVGFGLGLLVSIFYWGLLVAGQSIGIQRPDFPPFLAMWLPNFIILGLGLLFFIVRIRR